jgi:hypothetical protein
MTGRRRRRRKELLDGIKETRRYCKLKEEALDRSLWTTRLEEATAFRKGDYGMNDIVTSQKTSTNSKPSVRT